MLLILLFYHYSGLFVHRILKFHFNISLHIDNGICPPSACTNYISKPTLFLAQHKFEFLGFKRKLNQGFWASFRHSGSQKSPHWTPKSFCE